MSNTKNRSSCKAKTVFKIEPLAVAIGEAIEKIERPKAKAKQKAGGGDKKSPAAKSVGKTLPKRLRDESSRTTAQAAEAAGMSRPTYEKAKAVIESGDTELVRVIARGGQLRYTK